MVYCLSLWCIFGVILKLRLMNLLFFVFVIFGFGMDFVLVVLNILLSCFIDDFYNFFVDGFVILLGVVILFFYFCSGDFYINGFNY